MEIKSFILCEDIRTEVGDKNSLMGILNDGIHFNGPEADAWPKAINIAAFIQVVIQEDDQRPSTFTLNITIDGEDIASLQGDILIPETTRTLNIPATMSGLPLKSAGLLTFNFKLLDQGQVLLESETALNVSND